MSYYAAQEDFKNARRRAVLEQIMARLQGRSADLLSYEDVRRKLRATSTTSVQLEDIPLDAIVGSVGRYSDFTRSFLPRQGSDQERWARVQEAVTSLEGLPPIEVYQIGDAYFVRDGNHRVSVARQMGATHIQAHVTRIASRVPLSPDVEPDDLILKAEYAAFLEQTDLDAMRPGADLSLTVPGAYEQLLEHIEVHRYFMGLEEKRDISTHKAVADWYDSVYLPVVQEIRNQGILHDFPGRTEADLYLWVSEHRVALEEELEWGLRAGEAAAHLAVEHSPVPRRVIARLGERLRDVVPPSLIDSGPQPGDWRKSRLAARPEPALFADILVAVHDDSTSWDAVELALAVARREGGQLRGLHVVADEASRQAQAIQALRAEFDSRCARAGVPGTLAIATGKAARSVADRSLWSDLVVAGLAHAPGRQAIERLSAGFRNLLLWIHRPVLAVPCGGCVLDSALLAYDGSPKAREALFVAAYLAGRWAIPLTVVSIEDDDTPSAPLLEAARGYLEARQVTATLVHGSGPVAEGILKVANEHDSGLILMGGYGRQPVVDAVVGSTVDRILRQSARPTLICR